MSDATQPVGTADGLTSERLQRTMKQRWIWAIALGSAVGWGAFVLPTDWLATGGPAGVLLGFLIGGGLMILIAISYGFLIRSFPVSGGELAFALVGFGRTHAFFCGWFLTLGYACIVALNASATALLFRNLIPEVVQQGYLYTVAGWDVYIVEVLISLAALVVFALLNVRGAALSGRIQFIACVIMLLAVATIFIGVILSPGAALSNATPAFPTGVNPVAAIIAIVAIAPWAFVGFDNVPQAAEEFAFSPSKALRLIVFAILAAVVLYATMVMAVALTEPWERLVTGQSNWGSADAITGALGGGGMILLAVAVAMGVSTGLNGFFVASSRLLLSMGRAEMIPRAFSRLHPKHKTPYVGVLFVAAVCMVSPWFGRAALLWIVDMSSVGVTVAYLYTCLCAFRFFKTRGAPRRGAELEGARSTPKKVLSALGAVTSLTFLGLLLIPGSPGVLELPSFIALIVWIVLGLCFFLLRRGHNRTLSDEEVDVRVLGAPRPEAARFGRAAVSAPQ